MKSVVMAILGVIVSSGWWTIIIYNMLGNETQLTLIGTLVVFFTVIFTILFGILIGIEIIKGWEDTK